MSGGLTKPLSIRNPNKNSSKPLKPNSTSTQLLKNYYIGLASPSDRPTKLSNFRVWSTD